MDVCVCLMFALVLKGYFECLKIKKDLTNTMETFDITSTRNDVEVCSESCWPTTVVRP